MPASEPGAIRPDSWQRPLKFWEITPDKWRRFVAVHTRAPLALTNAVVPEMMRRGWGRIPYRRGVLEKSGEIDTRRRPVVIHMEAGDNRYAMNTDRGILNPLYSDNRLKLGVFGANVSNGCAATTAPGHLKMTWPDSREIVTIADQAGFEALVPVARWRGFGGATDFNGTCYDTLAWAAGMGAVTDHAAIFSTTHVPTIHPIVAAKQCTTVDHLTGGRFALNVVCGWYSQELRMFGLPPMDHDTRYAYADEWVEIVRKLWTAEEEFDFAGRFFKIEKGFHQPKPVQRPHPPIMNAGSSAIGARFAAKQADMAFIGFYEDGLEDGKAKVEEMRRIGREDFSRDFQIWTSCRVVCRPTEREARDYAHYYIHEKGDFAAVETIIAEQGRRDPNMPPEQYDRIKRRMVAGWGGYPLVGTAEQIVDELGRLSRAGLDGIVLSWVNYDDEMRQWMAEVMPLIEQAGLRKSPRAMA